MANIMWRDNQNHTIVALHGWESAGTLAGRRGQRDGYANGTARMHLCESFRLAVDLNGSFYVFRHGNLYHPPNLPNGAVVIHGGSGGLMKVATTKRALGIGCVNTPPWPSRWVRTWE